jgi:heme a synthase
LICVRKAWERHNPNNRGIQSFFTISCEAAVVIFTGNPWFVAHGPAVTITRFQKLATAALVSLLVLMFVGAIVRVTGAGMGCPDWPTCWGCLIPPTKLEQVDFSKLPIERFQEKAKRMGRDPATITVESLRKEFNPRHVWTEFLNRMTSLPVGFFSLATFIAAFWQREKRPLVFWMSFASIITVLVNAWMGAKVVYSGLKPGVLTTHLALAMGLIGMLVYCAWRGTDRPWRISMGEKPLAQLRLAVVILLCVTVAEGIIGSQVREMTDELAKKHLDMPRATWTAELEGSWKYLAHRSFSWAVLGASIWAWLLTVNHRSGGAGKVEKVVLGIVLAQMVLGLVMAQVHIYSWVQVLHVGLAAILLTFIWLWLFGLSRAKVG